MGEVAADKQCRKYLCTGRCLKATEVKVMENDDGVWSGVLSMDESDLQS